MVDEWIWIPNWDGPEGFQHYKGRDPIWIKNYTRLLSHDAYRDLSHHQRGILHGTWMAYATSGRRLRGSTLALTRQLGKRVTTHDLEALIHAGFIEIVASNVLAERLQAASDVLALTRARALAREREEEETPSTHRKVSSSSLRSEETDAAAPSAPNGPAPLNDESKAPHWCPHCTLGYPSRHDLEHHIAAEHAIDRVNA